MGFRDMSMHMYMCPRPQRSWCEAGIFKYPGKNPWAVVPWGAVWAFFAFCFLGMLAPRYPVALVRRSGGPRLRLRKHK